MSWSPDRYLQYADARLRPALDLLARIDLAAPRCVVDLGCGAGTVTGWLARRWPAATIVGVDGDAAMLERARHALANSRQVRWEQADLADWRPGADVDLIFSNAALHWLDGHATLLPGLLAAVAPGGVLAVQMPCNFDAPSHAELFALAWAPAWHEALAALVRPAPVAGAAQYYAWLAPAALSLDVWTTEYLQVLPARADGEHPVVAWMRGTALLPFVAALPERRREAFVAEYAERVARAYPRRADGCVLFPFRRRFLVAVREGGQRASGGTASSQP